MFKKKFMCIIEKIQNPRLIITGADSGRYDGVYIELFYARLRWWFALIVGILIGVGTGWVLYA